MKRVGRNNRLMVIGGGTGGHVFPGMAVANYLIAQGWLVRWLGNKDGIEAELVPKHGIDIDFISVQGLMGKSLKETLIAVIRLLCAIRHSIRIIYTWKPDIVLCMGGYVSGPGGVSAWICGIPVVIHEQNCIAGLTNRWLSKISSHVLEAFPGAFDNANAVVVGNPLRDELLTILEPSARMHGRAGPIRVLVIGGSQGAQILNKTMPAVAAILSESIILLHQVGKGALADVNLAYAGDNHRLVEFIDDIAAAYAWADLVVCRSGGMTVSEIAAVGLPALFVPFMYHKDRQQYWNARQLVKEGAAIIIEQHEFTIERVSEVLASFDRHMLLTMAQCARKVAIRDSTELVAKAVASVFIKNG